jgi:hypothetical protein
MATGPSMSAQSLDFGRLTDEYSKLTVREVVSSTGGVALAQLVATRAAIQLLTLVDARRFARVELVPSGGGTTHHFQKVQAVTASSSGEPTSDITLQDPTMTDVTAQLTMFRIGTFVSDMAQRQAAVNLAEVVGIAHGNAMNRDMNNDIYVTLRTNSVNTRALGASSDAKTTNYAWSDIFGIRGQIEKQRGRPDTFLTFPQSAAAGTGGAEIGWYPFVQSNISSVQFTAALADYLRTGSIAELFGLRLFVDQVYTPAAGGSGAGANNLDRLAHVLVSNEALGWAQAEDIVSEVQRWALQVGFRIISHSMGKSALVLDEFTGSINHA